MQGKTLSQGEESTMTGLKMRRKRLLKTVNIPVDYVGAPKTTAFPNPTAWANVMQPIQGPQQEN